VVTHDREIVDTMKKRVLTLEDGILKVDDATGRYGYEV
jgi:cell division transport system ATP-binding protein